MNRKKIKVPLYQHTIVLIQSDNLDDIIKKHNLVLSRKQYGGFCFEAESGEIYMCFDKNPNHATITHESNHCMSYIFKDIGYCPEQGNEEPACYLLAWIVDQCQMFLEF